MYPTDGDYERLLNDDDVVDAHTRAVIARACALEPSARPQTVTRFMDELMGRAPLPDALAADSHGGEDGVRRARRGAGRIGRTLRRLRDSVAALPMSTRVVGLLAALLCAALAVVLVFGGAQAMVDRFGGSGRAGRTVAESGSSTSSKQSEDLSQPRENGQGKSGQDGNGTSGGGSGADSSDSDKILRIGESGWYARDGYVHYAVELRDTSADKGVSAPTISIVGKDKEGKILFTDDSGVFQIDAGQSIWIGGEAGNGGKNPSTVEFKPVESSEYHYTSEGEWAFSIGSLNTSKSEETTNFTGEIRLTSRTAETMYQQARLALMLRDKNGKIVYGNMEFVPLPAEGETQAFSITEMNDEIPKYATFEVYAQPW